MWESFAVAAVFVFSLGFAVLVVKLPEILWRIRNPPEKIEEERRDYVARRLRPDWDFYGQHLGRAVPNALRQCFADPTLNSGGGFEFLLDGKSHYVLEFQAIDRKALVEAKGYYHLDVVPFAIGEGEAFYLRPGFNESNAVYSVFEESPYDGPEQEPEAEDVAIFLERLRASTRERS